MQVHRLSRVQRIQRPRHEVFAFFAKPENLEAITPSFLRFRIDSALPIEMRAGARIDYSLSLLGVPLRWRTRITQYEPDIRFVDEQERGPYASWRHLHEFESLGDSTEMRDVVEYALPFGVLGSLVHAIWVKRTLAAIFDHRERAILELLGAAGAAGSGVENPASGSVKHGASSPL